MFLWKLVFPENAELHCLPLRNEESRLVKETLIKNNVLDVSSKIILSSRHKTTPWFLTHLLYLGCVMVHTRMNAIADTTIPIVQIPNISTPCGFLQKTLTRLEEEEFHLLSNKPLSHHSECAA